MPKPLDLTNRFTPLMLLSSQEDEASAQLSQQDAAAAVCHTAAAPAAAPAATHSHSPDNAWTVITASKAKKTPQPTGDAPDEARGPSHKIQRRSGSGQRDMAAAMRAGDSNRGPPFKARLPPDARAESQSFQAERAAGEWSREGWSRRAACWDSWSPRFDKRPAPASRLHERRHKWSSEHRASARPALRHHAHRRPSAHLPPPPQTPLPPGGEPEPPLEPPEAEPGDGAPDAQAGPDLQEPRAEVTAPQPEAAAAAGEPQEAEAEAAEEAGVPEEGAPAEGEGLLGEVEQLRQLLEREKRSANLKLESVSSQLSKQEHINRKAFQRTAWLKRALDAAVARRQEVETRVSQQMEHIFHLSAETDALVFEVEQLRCQVEAEKRDTHLELAQRMEENYWMEAALAQANMAVESQRQQWDEEKGFLLAMKEEESARLLASLEEAEQDLLGERRRWQEERSCLLESFGNVQRKLEATDRTSLALIDRLGELEKKMDEGDKKPKQASLWKRIQGLFK